MYTCITSVISFTLDPGMYAAILYGLSPGARENFANPATCSFWSITLPEIIKITANVWYSYYGYNQWTGLK